MVINVEQDAAFSYLLELEIEKQTELDEKQKVFFNSIASAKDSLQPSSNSIFKRLFLRIFHHKKSVITVGEKEIPVFSYDTKSNVAALRTLFADALDSRKVGDSEGDSKKVLNFAIDLERKVGCAKENGNCFSILEEHFFKQLKGISSLDGLTKLCNTPEAKVFFSQESSEAVTTLLQLITNNEFLSSTKALGMIFKQLTAENKAEFQSQVWRMLEAKYTGSEGQSFGKYIDELRASGMEFSELDNSLSKLIEDQIIKMNKQKNELLEEFKTATLENFKEKIIEYNAKLQKTLAEDQIELESRIPKDKKSICMQKKALQGQLHILADFTTKSISHFISLIDSQSLSPDQKTEALSWMTNLLAEFESLILSPDGARDDSLKEVIAQLKNVIKKLSPVGPPVPVGKSDIIPMLTHTAEKVAEVSKKVFHSLPFVLTFVAPVAFAAYSGSKVGGLSGAVISGAVAAVTAIGSCLGAKVSGWAASKVAQASLFPECTKNAVQTTFTFVFQLGLTLTAMQANCIISGSLANVLTPVAAAPVAVNAAVDGGGVFSWFTNTAPVAFLSRWLGGVTAAGGVLGSEAAGATVAGGSFVASEASLFHAVVFAPQSGWPILGRISNIFSRQVAAGTAGYAYGGGMMRSLKAGWHFVIALVPH